MNRFYVYALIDPITNEPFYIGKGSGDRLDRQLRLIKISAAKKGKPWTEARRLAQQQRKSS